MTINYPPLSEYEFLIKYLQITNLLLEESQRLTYAEMEMIAAITSLPDEKFRYQRFSLSAKRRVATFLNITLTNINNKIHALKQKGFIRKDEDRVLYLPKHVLKAAEEFRAGKGATISFSFELEDENKNNGNSD